MTNQRLIFFAVAILIAIPVALLAGESSGQEASRAFFITITRQTLAFEIW
jgi:hypothetical protein